MKLDLHVHTCYSEDCSVSVEDAIETAVKSGLNGIAITDHNEIAGALRGLEIAKNIENFVLIPGMEISTENGHLIALNVREKIQPSLSPKKTVDKIKELGGFVICPHPFRPFSGLGSSIVRVTEFDAIETYNARSSIISNKRALWLADKLKLGKSAGSDAHFKEEIGSAYIEIQGNNYNIDFVLDKIKNNEAVPNGMSASAEKMIRTNYRGIKLWLKRRMVRI
ncbi:MAG: PHP domain-containing protein [Thermoplasmata archaeon]